MSATGGVVAVVMWIQQMAWGVASTRVGERFMQNTGPRSVIITASILVATAIALMMVTNVSQGAT